MSNVPFDFLWDFNASAKRGPSSTLGRSGQDLTHDRRVQALVITDHRCWILSSQGKLYHEEMEMLTLSVLDLCQYTKPGNISAAVRCVPACTCMYDSEVFYHYCMCSKCWGDVEVLQNDQFY